MEDCATADAEREGIMTPVQAISLNDSSYMPFKSYDAHQAVFRIDAKEGANLTSFTKVNVPIFDQWLRIILVQFVIQMVR